MKTLQGNIDKSFQQPQLFSVYIYLNICCDAAGVFISYDVGLFTDLP